MTTMNISLPEPLKDFVDEQVERGAYSSTSEYVRELIRRDHDRSRLRGLLLAGAESPADVAVDDAFFAELRDRARQPSADG
jgi:antitoxin ParD1/3/4